MSLSFVVFSIINWSFLWQLAGYVDTAMIRALDPVGGLEISGHAFGGMSSLIDMIGILMYIVIPIFWTFFMGWAGLQAGGGVTSLIDRATAVSSGGAAATGLVSKAASSVTKSI